MQTIKAIKIAILSYVHFKGWCEKLHKAQDPDSWHSGCPLVDRINMDLFPPIVWQGSQEAFRDVISHKGLRPGLVVAVEKKEL